MSKIQIICTNPGMRRHGVTHPGMATYEADRWTKDEIEAFRADPAFIVQEIGDDAVVSRGPEFDQAVAEEVARQLKAKAEELQKGFEAAVKDAAAERISAAEDKLAIATGRIVELEKQIEDKAKPAAKAK